MEHPTTTSRKMIADARVLLSAENGTANTSSSKYGAQYHGCGRPASKYKIKTSVGLIMCRTNESTGKPEVLLVHRRYTYAFIDFIHGRYTRRNSIQLGIMFNEMTTDELLDIMSLDFSKMWYRVWLNSARSDLYNKKNSRFRRMFIDGDGGASLIALIRQAKGLGTLWWEIPKGKQNQGETEISCASRETEEETGVHRSEYQIIPESRRLAEHTSRGIKYINVYYTAIASPRLSRAATHDSKRLPVMVHYHEQVSEVNDVKWMTIGEIQFVDQIGDRPGSECGGLDAVAKSSFRLMKKFRRGGGSPAAHSTFSMYSNKMAMRAARRSLRCRHALANKRDGK